MIEGHLVSETRSFIAYFSVIVTLSALKDLIIDLYFCHIDHQNTEKNIVIFNYVVLGFVLSSLARFFELICISIQYV